MTKTYDKFSNTIQPYSQGTGTLVESQQGEHHETYNSVDSTESINLKILPSR